MRAARVLRSSGVRGESVATMASSALIYQIGYVAGMTRSSAMLALVTALGALCAFGAADAAGREWTVVPPAGWQENSGLAAQLSEQMGSEIAGFETAAWQSSDGRADSLMVQWLVVKDAGNRGYLDSYDRDFQRELSVELGDGATAAERPERVVDGVIIRDTVLTSRAMRLRAVRHYRAGRDGLHVLTATCTSEPNTTPCDAALDGARLVVAGAVSLDDQGRLLQFVVAGVVLIGLGVVFWRARGKRG